MLSVINILLIFLFGLNNNSDTIISKYLSEKLVNYTKFNYEIVSPKSIDLNKINIDRSRKFKLNKNYGYLPVNIKSVNGKINKSLITVKLKLFDKVFVAKRKILTNEFLDKSDFTLMEKEVSSLNDHPFSKLNLINHFKARTIIYPESVLENRMIKIIPDIEIGDRVNALYSKGIVNVSFSAVSRSRGVVDDVIKIKRDDNKIFKARVLNNNTVKIIE